MISNLERKKLAESYFLKGYNCSQALLLSFSDLIKINKKDLLKIASSFGGGMCRLRLTCGAVSASYIVIGYIFGYDKPNDDKNKAKLYKIGQEFMKLYLKKFKVYKCSDFLNKLELSFDYKPTKRTSEFYKNRPCTKIIGDTAFLLNSFINKKLKSK